MCALFGWLDYSHVLSKKTLSKLTQALANAAESRGTDATGIAYVSNGSLNIYKKAKAAHKLRLTIPHDTAAVMGHTRLATQGNQRDNYNNHPFFGHCDQRFALAHNGVLYNDKVLRREHHLPKTRIETDSYIAVQLIEEQKSLSFSSLKKMAESVSGSFAFTILDEENSLWIVKGSSPMEIVLLPEVGLLVYASTKEILNSGLRAAGLLRYLQKKIDITEGDIVRIRCDAQIERETFSYDDYENYYGFGRSLGYDEDELQYLLDISHYFGAKEEDIELLYDVGYTVWEIEEVLMDRNEFNKTMQDVRCCCMNKEYNMVGLW